MAKRIVEVQWEDSVGRHGWSDHLVEAHVGLIHSLGYVMQDDGKGMLLLTGMDGSETSADQYDCSKFIPRSAIRNVIELRPKGRK